MLFAKQGRISRGRWGDFRKGAQFRGADDNAFITPNIERNCYAIAIKHSMSGDGWRRRE